VGVVAEGERRTLVLALQGGAWIVGRARREDGGPAVGAHVQATLGGRWLPPLPAAVVGADGGYRLGPLLDGVVGVGAATASDERMEETEVRLGAGETRTVDLVVAAGDLAISGRVVDEAGHPVATAALALYSRDERELPAARTLSGVDGTFTLAGLPRGTYLLTAGHPDFAPARQHVEAGRAIELPLLRE
jgi:hypothetical protein